MIVNCIFKVKVKQNEKIIFSKMNLFSNCKTYVYVSDLEKTSRICDLFLNNYKFMTDKLFFFYKFNNF